MILVTGGAGFIGSNFVLDWLAAGGEPVVNLDKLTYPGLRTSLAEVVDHPVVTEVGLHPNAEGRILLDTEERPTKNPRAFVVVRLRERADRGPERIGDPCPVVVVYLRAARGGRIAQRRQRLCVQRIRAVGACLGTAAG